MEEQRVAECLMAWERLFQIWLPKCEKVKCLKSAFEGTESSRVPDGLREIVPDLVAEV